MIIIGRGVLGWQVWVDQGTPGLFNEVLAHCGVDRSGWEIDGITGISADGSTVIGVGGHVSWEPGRTEGIVFTIPPPGSLSVVALGLVAFRRRR